MKAFSFRLERLLRLRGDAEQRQAVVLGEAARAEAEMEGLCRDQHTYLAGMSDRLQPTVGQVTSAGMMRTLQLTGLAAANQLEQAEQERDEARRRADTERERLAEARRERKTLERLKENQRTAWRGEVDRDEQKTMDEIAGRSRGSSLP
ncbi:MAG: flagellar export protein FliJ [Gemmatimonadales bacterium]|nr:flagellar export protein FliJ [Gemmatimonadales bacterium]